MKNPIKMDDLGVPLFLETPISKNPKDLDSNSLPSGTHHTSNGSLAL